MKKLYMLGIIIIALVLIVKFSNNVEYSSYEGEYFTYTIKANETLWNIARNYAKDKNIQEVIYTIKKDNNIKDVGNLQIGQKILLREEY